LVVLFAVIGTKSLFIAVKDPLFIFELEGDGPANKGQISGNMNHNGFWVTYVRDRQLLLGTGALFESVLRQGLIFSPPQGSDHFYLYLLSRLPVLGVSHVHVHSVLQFSILIADIAPAPV